MCFERLLPTRAPQVAHSLKRNLVVPALILAASILPACASLFGQSSESSLPKGISLVCVWDEVGRTAPSAPGDRSESPPTAGQMSESAVAAKRLFDQERYAEAAAALAEVMDGRTGDDQGNRELAQYHLAIAYYKLDRLEECARLFCDIAARPSHVKFSEAELWLGRLATEPRTTLQAIDALYAYSEGNTVRFNNPNQRDLYWLLQFTTGRAAFRRGDEARALKSFQSISPESPYLPLARDCLRFVPHGEVPK
jgi:hypothetical protein